MRCTVLYLETTFTSSNFVMNKFFGRVSTFLFPSRRIKHLFKLEETQYRPMI